MSMPDESFRINHLSAKQCHEVKVSEECVTDLDILMEFPDDEHTCSGCDLCPCFLGVAVPCQTWTTMSAVIPTLGVLKAAARNCFLL